MPYAPTVLSIAHALPGRIRFRLPVLLGQVEAAKKLEETLGGIKGISSVCVSTATGSVLIQHDEDQLSPELLAAALYRLLGLENELTGDVEARIGRELREFCGAANRAMYEKTAGLLDLKTTLFLALAVVGLSKFVRQRSLALPAGFTLLWWAGNGLLRGKQACL